MFHFTNSIKKLLTVSVISILLFSACTQGGQSTPNNEEGVSQPTVVVANPTSSVEVPIVNVQPETDIQLDVGNTISLQATATGGGSIKYHWELEGPGSLSDTRDKPAVIYTAPLSLEGADNAIVFLTVSNEAGDTQASISITVRDSALALANLGTPEVPSEGEEEAEVDSEEETIEDSVADPEEEQREECDLISVRFPIEGPDFGITAEFTTPENCKTDLPAATPTNVGGTLAGNIDGLEFWILVNIDGQYWPQSPNACGQLPAEASSERWGISNVYIGAQGDQKQFDIVLTVTEADGDASTIFKQWLKTGCDTGDFPGMVVLPEGLTELDSITIKTTG